MKNYDENIREKLCEYDVGINCSFAEGFGRVTVEYMAAGLAVIASNRGANGEIINHLNNGLIYSKDIYNDLLHKIEELINNEALRKKLANNAKKNSRNYDVNITCEEIYKLYINLCDS